MNACLREAAKLAPTPSQHTGRVACETKLRVAGPWLTQPRGRMI
jgi:hypothetical protein